MIATHALLLLDVPIGRVMQRLQGQLSARYRLLHEFFPRRKRAGMRGRRAAAPPPAPSLEGGDTVVLFGSRGDTAEAERMLLT